ncbi:MAG TPA: hypothetical protein VN887_02470 [Candidatus Angelobacter sp.]|nr:hypothetical protein [Candidatus Angelobacter sp.]
MKIKTNNNPQGSALLATMLVAFVVGMALAGYLTLVSFQSQSTLRSLAWNSSIPATEAGVEEALTALYYYGTTNLSAGFWTMNADGFYHKTGRLGNSSTLSFLMYDVGIKPPPPLGPDTPIIECIGYSPTPPNLTTYYIKPYGMILGGLVPAYTPELQMTKRKVRVLAKRQTPTRNAMLAKGQIDLKGNNIATDSFDSQDPNYSTNGKYDSSKHKANGDVATNQGLVNSVNVGNADILGHVHTGPNGSVSIGANGSVGDLSWKSSGNTGVEPGYTADDSNVDITDVQTPPWVSGGYSTPSGGKWPPLVGSTYDLILAGGNNYVVNGNFSGKIIVVGSGNANVYISPSGSFSMTGQDQITISTNTSLQVYNAASSASIGGNGVVNNADALAFLYWGLPSNTSISYNGNAAFTGVIYAPEADFTLGGGGNNTYDFVGASVTKSVTMNGHFNFHYDESIGRRFPIGQYVVGLWNEISPN